MATKKPFEIDISDLEAIRAKLMQAEDTLEDKREMVREAQREFAYWQSVVDRLRLLAGPTKAAARPDTGRAPTAGSIVVSSVTASVEPLRASDIMRMHPELSSRDTVSYSLWKAEKDGEIKRVGPGLYARLDYEAPAQQDALRLVES